MEPKNSESKIGAPEPRANCTANLFKDKVYIFGGHDIREGSMESLWSFDVSKIGDFKSTLRDMEWKEV